MEAPPEGEQPWFVPVVTPRDDDSVGPSDAAQSGEPDGDETDGGEPSGSVITVAPGTTLAWSPWAEEEQLPDRLMMAIRGLAHRLTEDLPELSHQNPEGGQQFDHAQLEAALANALGALSEVADGRTLQGDDLADAMGAAHDGAVISAIMAEATGEPAVAAKSYWLQQTAEEVRRAMWRRFAPMGDDQFRVRLRRGERALIGRVLAEQQQRLADDGPELAPLFPAGYGDADPIAAEASAEFASLTRDDLMLGRSTALKSVQASLGERVIDTDTLSAWMRTLNDVRLVMAVELGIDHDEQPPPAPWDSSFPAWRTYALLGNLVHEAVESLRTQL